MSQSQHPTSSSTSQHTTILDTISNMFTTTFTQHATSQLTFKSSPPSSVSKERLDALGLETAIKLLQSHQEYIRLNPIVTDTHEIDPTSEEGERIDVPSMLASFIDPNDPESDYSSAAITTDINHTAPENRWKHYSITDELPHPLGLPGTTTLVYQAALHNLVDGFESLVLAAASTTIHGRLRIRQSALKRDGQNGFAEDDGERTLWLQEKIEVRCWLGTGWYIQKSLGDSHGMAHERFRAWWEREVRRRAVAEQAER